MPMIPTIVAPEKDELLYSWLFRLIKVNHADPATFVNHYFFMNGIQKTFGNYNMRYDSFENFANLYDQADEIHQRNNYFPDGLSLFLNHTVFSTLSPCLNEAQRENIVLNVFRQSGTAKSIVTKLHMSYLKQFRYCPMCMQEDIQNGRPMHLHLFHNLPTITACTKHHCKLLTIPDKSVKYFLTEQDGFLPDTSVIETSEEEIKYASFLQDFQNAHFDFNMRTTMHTIHSKLEETGYKTSKEGFINELKLSQEKKDRITRFLNNMWTHTGDYMALYMPDDTLYALYLLFESVDNFRKYLTDVPEQKPIPSDFTLLSQYRDDLIRVRHDQCGSIFYTSPGLLNDGWGCRYCDRSLTDEKIFNRIFHAEVRNEYQLLSQYKDMNHNILIKHNKCGRVYEVKAGLFVRQHRRCICLQGPRSKDEVQSMFDQYCPGYQLIDYKDMSSHCTIKCPKCGRIVEYSSPSHFLVRKKCKKCYPKFYEKDDFQARMKQLVGDEYSLLDDYKNTHTKATFRHNLCGNKFQVTPTQFAHGYRCQCPECRINMPFDLMSEYVRIRTDDRYTIEEIKGSNRARCLLIDHDTGLTRTPLRATIMQELTRPTPSDLMEYLNPVHLPETTSLERRLQKKGITYFRLKDLHGKISLKWDNITEQVGNLLIARRIKLIQPNMGLYAVSNANISADEIISHYFIMKNNHRVGFSIGTRFLNEIGVKTDHVARPSIVTSAINSDTSINLNNTRYSLTFCKYGQINDDNWPYLAIMYWLVGQTYSRKPEIQSAITNFIAEHHLTANGFKPYHNIMGSVVEKRLNYLIKNLEL